MIFRPVPGGAPTLWATSWATANTARIQLNSGRRSGAVRAACRGTCGGIRTVACRPGDEAYLGGDQQVFGENQQVSSAISCVNKDELMCATFVAAYRQSIRSNWHVFMKPSALLVVAALAFGVWAWHVNSSASPSSSPMSVATGSTCYCKGCGCKGGPGWRGQYGQCVSHANLTKDCGSPLSMRCTYEGARQVCPSNN